jgi:hypothetical protein
MDKVYYTTREPDGSLNSIDVIDGVRTWTHLLSLKNSIFASSGVSKLIATRWKVLRFEGGQELDALTPIQDLLSITPIPGSKESPLILVSPESQTPSASEPSNKRKRTLPLEFPVFTTPVVAPQVSEELDGKFIRVPAGLAKVLLSGESVPVPDTTGSESDLENSDDSADGRLIIDSDLLLYKRRSLCSQLAFLENIVLKGRKRGWILGPPGTGKSVTAFLFARQIASRGWVATWVKCVSGVPLYCVRLENDMWSSCKITADFAVSDYFHTAEMSSKHVVLLDGYRSGKGPEPFLLGAKEWRANRKKDRRLVIIASLASRDANDADADEVEAEFFEDSWDKAEYLAACEHEDLFNSVRANLDAPLCSSIAQPSIEDLIAAKFYYSGGSARYTFMYNTEKVMSQISKAASKVENVQSYITQWISDASKSVVNRLANSYNTSTGIRRVSILSSFASLELAVRGGPESIRAIKSALRVYGNKSLEGWIFELLFFARLTCQGLRLKSKTGKVRDFDEALWPLESDVPAKSEWFTGKSEVWIRPARWNQPGFDAVFICPENKTVEFFQVTQSLKHKFALRHFADCLTSLDPKLNFTVLVNVVVPLANLHNFKPNVTDIRQIQRFDKKWAVKSHLQILGMEDIHT